jgi:ribokinase
MRFDIVSFGAGLVDLFIFTDVHEKGRMICYNVGAKLQVKKSYFDVGGGGINTGTTFSRMGLKTGMLSKIGKEELSSKILEKLKKEKIKFIGKIEGNTGYSIILDSREHDRTILTFKGDNDNLKASEIKNIDAKWLYFSSMAKESFKSQLKLAKSRKHRIAYNPSLYLFDEEKVRELVKYTEILILNKEEADMLDTNHQRILDLGPSIVIVTNGKSPFKCYTPSRMYTTYPHENVRVVERTGAGDAFASGFVASYIKTGNIEKSLQVGVANSESVVQYLGSTNVILTLAQALKEIKKNPCKIDIENS